MKQTTISFLHFIESNILWTEKFVENYNKLQEKDRKAFLSSRFGKKTKVNPKHHHHLFIHLNKVYFYNPLASFSFKNRFCDLAALLSNCLENNETLIQKESFVDIDTAFRRLESYNSSRKINGFIENELHYSNKLNQSFISQLIHFQRKNTFLFISFLDESMLSNSDKIA